MRTKKIAAAAAVLLAGASGLAAFHGTQGKDVAPYRLATVERGNVQASVSATGTLSAVTTVQVGTQVSGQVSAIYADFNTHVKKGQLLARIDPTLAEQAVQDAETGVAKAQATLTQTQQEYEREKPLYDQQFITASDFSTTQANYEVAKAGLQSAQIALDKARQNLAYTSIYAPIDGVIVERNVDVGQTVAANFSAPQLFLIANDLSQMQILASVDESDIGAIKTGQPVRFTVEAYPNQTFTGTVKQVRLQSTTTNNVVNYTVVVSVGNPDGKLLPGMTATVQFLTGDAQNVTLVPNAALRFRPTAQMLAQVGAGTSQKPQGQKPQARTPAANTSTVWYLDASGKPTMARVQTGLSDGQETQVNSPALTPGTQVIVGLASTTASTSSATASPFQPQSGGRRGGGF